MPDVDDHQDLGELHQFGQGARRAAELYVQDQRLDEFRRIVDNPSYALNQDPLTWQKIRRDTVFAFIIDTRRRKVASKAFTIEPATDHPDDQTAASIVEQAFKTIGRFGMVRYNLTDADFRGTAYAMMTGQLRPWAPVTGDALSEEGLDKRAPSEWWMFNTIRDVDPYRFRFRNIEDRRIIEFASIDKKHKMKWEPLLHPEWFIRHVYEDNEASKGYGNGLVEALFFMWYTKMLVLEIGLQGVEAWANGRLDVAVKGLREASAGKPNSEIQRQWQGTVRQWLRDHAIVHDIDDTVTMKEGPGRGHDMVLDFINYCDSAACRLTLGSELPFGGNQGGGSLARAKEEGEQSDEYLQMSRDLLADTLTEGLLTFWWERNISNIREIAPKADRPKLSLTPQPVEDPKEQAFIANTLLSAGVPLKKAEVYRKTGYTQPSEEDDVIEPMLGGGGAGAEFAFGTPDVSGEGFRTHIEKLLTEQTSRILAGNGRRH